MCTPCYPAGGRFGGRGGGRGQLPPVGAPDVNQLLRNRGDRRLLNKIQRALKNKKVSDGLEHPAHHECFPAKQDCLSSVSAMVPVGNPCRAQEQAPLHPIE